MFEIIYYMNKHYIIYQITNLINNKIYIGCHSTFNINDNYMGSGSAIQQAILKYGRENFKKEILVECDNEEHMDQLEREFVDIDFINRSDTYNLITGGIYNEKGSGRKSRTISDETRMKFINTVPVIDSNGNTFKVSKFDERYINGELKHTSTGRIVSDVTKQKMSQKAIGRNHSEVTKIKISLANQGINNSFYGKTHSEEVKQKISIACTKPKGKMSEEHKLNLSESAKNRIWITSSDLIELKRIKKDKLDSYLDNGWILGIKRKK